MWLAVILSLQSGSPHSEGRYAVCDIGALGKKWQLLRMTELVLALTDSGQNYFPVLPELLYTSGSFATRFPRTLISVFYYDNT